IEGSPIEANRCSVIRRRNMEPIVCHETVNTRKRDRGSNAPSRYAYRVKLQSPWDNFKLETAGTGTGVRANDFLIHVGLQWGNQCLQRPCGLAAITHIQRTHVDTVGT